jgi:4'-phosphopantetheinyl transferase
MQETRHHPKSVIWAWVQVDPSTGETLDLIARLSPADRERAARFHRAEDRHRFIAGRGLLAALLRQSGEAASVPLQLDLTEHDRPFLPNSPQLAFSISHAGTVVAVALARNARVGLDVEALDRRVDFAAVAERIFNPADLARFHALPESGQPRAFFRAWTGKEAILKGRGVGLSGGLQSIAAPFDDHAALLTDAGETWHLRSLPLPAGHVGCIACDHPDFALFQQDIQPDRMFA